LPGGGLGGGTLLGGGLAEGGGLAGGGPDGGGLAGGGPDGGGPDGGGPAGGISPAACCRWLRAVLNAARHSLDSCSRCVLKQATTRPPPGATSAQ